MHWNVIEYARGEAVEVWWKHAWYRGTIVGVNVQPKRPVRYYVRIYVGVIECSAAQVRREQG